MKERSPASVAQCQAQERGLYVQRLAVHRSGRTSYDLHDQLGTATKQTDASASVSASRTYDAFGLLIASTDTPQGPFGFAATSGYQEDGRLRS